MTGAQLSLPVTDEYRIGHRIIRDVEDASELRHRYLEALREEMRKLYRKRLRERGPAEAWVCADDARRLFESWNPPEPEELSRSFLGALFLPDGWKPCGYVRSETPGSHGNLLRRWRWVGGDHGD